jgi:hypothetical protein
MQYRNRDFSLLLCRNAEGSVPLGLEIAYPISGRTLKNTVQGMSRIRRRRQVGQIAAVRTPS